MSSHRRDGVLRSEGQHRCAELLRTCRRVYMQQRSERCIANVNLSPLDPIFFFEALSASAAHGTLFTRPSGAGPRPTAAGLRRTNDLGQILLVSAGWVRARTSPPAQPRFKAEAVQMVLETGRSIAEVARDFGIHEETPENWVNGRREPHEAHQSFPSGARPLEGFGRRDPSARIPEEARPSSLGCNRGTRPRQAARCGAL